MRKFLPLILLFAVLSCGDDGPSRPSGPTDPPEILLVSLAPQAVVAGPISIRVGAEQADIVELRVDGEFADSDSTAPFDLFWNTEQSENGPRTLTIRARNQAGFADTCLTCYVNNLGTGVVILVDPPEAEVLPQRTIQFRTLVFGTHDFRVSWSVEATIDVAPETGLGTVDSTGLYTAPETPPPGAVVLVRATSAADPGASGYAAVTLGPGVAVVITKAPTTVFLGDKYYLAARVYGTTDTQVDWSVVEGATHGSIDEKSIYTAPDIMPDPPRVTFRAVSRADAGAVDQASAEVVRVVNVSIVEYPEMARVGRIFPLSALVTGTADTRVEWTVDEGPDHGFIDEIDGGIVYHAPEVLPQPAHATLRVRSLVDRASTHTAVVALQDGIVVNISPAEAVLAGGAHLAFNARLENTTDPRVRWSVDGGAAFGTIDATGVYFAPRGAPDSLKAFVRATSVADPLYQGRARVTVLSTPPAYEAALIPDLFHSAEYAGSVSELATGVTIKALGLAARLNGRTLVTGGTLTYEDSDWVHAPGPPGKLHIIPPEGPRWAITINQVDEGALNLNLSDLSYPFMGADFLGDLDCVVEIDNRAIHIVHAYTEGEEFTRQVTGEALLPESGLWSIDVEHRGMPECSSHHVWCLEERISGTLVSPGGAVMDVDGFRRLFAGSDPFLGTAESWRYDINVTATRGLHRYAWPDVGVRGAYRNQAIDNPAAWVATGALEKDGEPYAAIAFDGPVTTGDRTGPNAVIDYAVGYRVVLRRPGAELEPDPDLADPFITW